MIALIAAATALVSPAGSYRCNLNEVAAVGIKDGKADASRIDGLPAESLKFTVSFQGGSATVDWPNSPIQASGKQTVLGTAPAAGMILIVSPGPCLFTESACASMINYAQQPDRSLEILVTPTAVSYDSEHKVRFPFLVSMHGLCSPIEDRK